MASPSVTQAAMKQIKTIQLYRDLLRVATRVGKINDNEDTLKSNIRVMFKRNRFETNQEKIDALREQAMLALSNYLVHEAQRMAQAGQVSRDQIDVDFPEHNNGL